MTTLTRTLAKGHTARRPAGVFSGLFANLIAMAMVRRQRRQLRDLDDAILADLGLTRAEAEAESQRAAWDVPAKWRS